ncbi:toxin-antitoxin system HicB family antitoxin [Pseudomonas sp. NPDC078700]|uniref:toxin-antitoxin system HicB family antitoxin n=1 Tax=Pseudomonas sp. NPDC078700 TaxID=3364424 RepID=UPI0037C85819
MKSLRPKPSSGTLNLDLEPELHTLCVSKAELEKKSINQWVTEVLSREAHA